MTIEGFFIVRCPCGELGAQKKPEAEAVCKDGHNFRPNK